MSALKIYVFKIFQIICLKCIYNKMLSMKNSKIIKSIFCKLNFIFICITVLANRHKCSIIARIGEKILKKLKRQLSTYNSPS